LSLEQADGTQLEIVLQSNDFCLKQKSVIQIPNAFAPNSQKVNFFRPLIAFESSVSDYSMQIFDRNAGLLFKTEDLHEGWEGNSISGRFIQQGVYVYLIRFTQADGTPVVKKGTVTLLR
jgi:gliding motility-associated-like protein